MTRTIRQIDLDTLTALRTEYRTLKAQDRKLYEELAAYPSAPTRRRELELDRLRRAGWDRMGKIEKLILKEVL